MKKIIKEIIFAVSTSLIFPLLINLKIIHYFQKSNHYFMSLGQFCSLFPGKFGSYLRVAFYNKAVSSFSKNNVYIGFGSYFSHHEVEVEDGVYIGAYCIIGKALIRRDVTIGSHVNILSGKRQHKFEEIGRPIQQQGGIFETIEIGENCWIGNGSIIMANLGKQCIVGAGSVITSNTGDYEVLAGNPARVIRKLTESENIH